MVAGGKVMVVEVVLPEGNNLKWFFIKPYKVKWKVLFQSVCNRFSSGF